MIIKKYLSQNSFILKIRLFFEYYKIVNLYSIHLGSSKRQKIQEKFKADLTIRFHAIEKGLAIGNTKIGFGENKILSALSDLQIYFDRFHDLEFVKINLLIAKSYLDFNKSNGVEVNSIKHKVLDVCSKCNIKDIDSFYQIEKNKVGIDYINFENLNLESLTFNNFSQTRFSIRDFDSTIPLDKNKIFESLKISQRTPSACNRQPWHVHLFSGEIKNELLDFQGGCNGFSRDIEYAVLITIKLNGYFIHEINQPYVDGGLYAMNLIYALHSNNIATIPLTMALKQDKIKKLKRKFKLPENEVPILVIGLGSFKKSCKVAVSFRGNYNSYLTEY